MLLWEAEEARAVEARGWEGPGTHRCFRPADGQCGLKQAGLPPGSGWHCLAWGWSFRWSSGLALGLPRDLPSGEHRPGGAPVWAGLSHMLHLGHRWTWTFASQAPA